VLVQRALQHYGFRHPARNQMSALVVCCSRR
jgi:hypothetical protein